jgi:hypothetical protein
MKTQGIEQRLQALEHARREQVEIIENPFANASREELLELAGRVVADEDERPGRYPDFLVAECRNAIAN